jgi:hypothetical protein
LCFLSQLWTQPFPWGTLVHFHGEWHLKPRSGHSTHSLHLGWYWVWVYVCVCVYTCVLTLTHL